MCPLPQTSFSLAELSEAFKQQHSWHVNLVQPVINGGRISAEALAQLDEQPAASALTISGLDQKTFEVLVSRYGRRLAGLHLWKCPRIADLTPLEDLPDLTHFASYWNQRSTRLWNFARTPRLVGLEFLDFRRLTQLNDLSAAKSLRELHFGDAVFRKARFESLSPLESLEQLERLDFDARVIDDGRVQPLAQLSRLTSIELPMRMFTIRQMAWLRARLPDSVKSESLAPLWFLPADLLGEDAQRSDVVVVGRGQRRLSSTLDGARLQKVQQDFWAMVSAFRADPHAGPE
jgi:hypothetical protein